MQPRCRVAAALLLLLGCDPPDNALVHGCSYGPLELATHCYVRAKRLDRQQFAHFDANTKNQLVRVSATVRVQRGEVTIDVAGCEQGKGVARPGQPAVIHCESKLNRNTYTFSLGARPTSMPVEGIEGEVTFQPI
jgi:hypothetical protein